ncbi:hypothetical protein [Acetobacteroides hydrogenigenes]|uniref:hypothetical protein n=1 Tax=Acetobacteroides hydrogenigenes TaxID=979970 RepID=UPI001048E2A7|nr:hypothetical protein [Acetobacteroides hydrogenigenes]
MASGIYSVWGNGLCSPFRGLSPNLSGASKGLGGRSVMRVAHAQTSGGPSPMRLVLSEVAILEYYRNS